MKPKASAPRSALPFIAIMRLGARVGRGCSADRRGACRVRVQQGRNSRTAPMRGNLRRLACSSCLMAVQKQLCLLSHSEEVIPQTFPRRKSETTSHLRLLYVSICRPADPPRRPADDTVAHTEQHGCVSAGVRLRQGRDCRVEAAQAWCERGLVRSASCCSSAVPLSRARAPRNCSHARAASRSRSRRRASARPRAAPCAGRRARCRGS
jgi:hypothetical protein